MANTKDHHLHSVCPCCDVVQHIKAIICCHGILTLSNRNAHTRDANTLKTKTTLLFTVFKFTVLCTTLLSSRAIIPVIPQICVQSTVHECTKKGVSHQINIKLDHFLMNPVPHSRHRLAVVDASPQIHLLQFANFTKIIKLQVLK